jgi:hypothetical protein
MPLLDYANLTIPDLVKKYNFSFENRDPLISRIRAKNKVIRSGGTQVRIRRVKGGHSQPVEINATNIEVPLVKIDSFGVMTADWSKMIKPIILPHLDRDRLGSKDEVKRWVDNCTKAALTSHYIAMARRLYTGAGAGYYLALGSLNGNSVNGTVTGLANGALRFQTPANQVIAAITYLNDLRTADIVNFTDNWHNQWGQHTGFGVDFLRTVEEVKATADCYTETENDDGISIGVLSIQDFVALGEEVRTYGGGGMSTIAYSVDDIKSGKAHPSVQMAAGIQFFPNRWMTDALTGQTDACYLLNPNGIEYWVNAGNDHRVTKITDRLETSNYDADVGFIIVEVQFAVPNLLVQGCVCQ